MKKRNPNAPIPVAGKEVIPNQEAQPAVEPVGETEAERDARIDRATLAIREILKKETCTIMVPTLDISSGRVFPKVEVVALQLPAQAPAAAQ